MAGVIYATSLTQDDARLMTPRGVLNTPMEYWRRGALDRTGTDGVNGHGRRLSPRTTNEPDALLAGLHYRFDTWLSPVPEM